MLNFVGNVIWLVSSLCIIPIVYLIYAIILFPLFPFLLPVIKLTFLPFGRELVTQSYLSQFHESSTLDETAKSFNDTKRVVRIIANIVWPLLIGWQLALLHIIAALLSIIWGLFFFFTLVGPVAGLVNAKVHLKLVPVAFTPFGRTIISADVAKKLNDIKAEREVKDITG